MEERIYNGEEILEMILKAEQMGFSLEEGSELEKLTLGELDRLVNGKAS